MPHTIYTETQTQTLWRIASGFALGEILDELAHRLQAASPGLRAAFLRVERAQPAHPPLLRLCCAPSMGDMYRDYMNGTGLVRGSSPIADVALTGSPIYIQNCETDTRLSPDTRAAYRRFGASCYIAPLLEPRTAAVIGVVCLSPGHTNAPSP